MPNWCSTWVQIHCTNEVQAKNLENLINEWTERNYCENGFGHNWLGNIVGNSGIDNRNHADGDFKISCRGYIDTFTKGGTIIYISQEDAWSPHIKLWLEVIERYAEGAQLFYTAEECGMELYLTNMDEFAGKYIIDPYDDFVEGINGEEIYYENDCEEKDVVEFLRYKLKRNETNINKLMKLFYESDLSDDMGIHKWEYCNEFELD